MSKAPSRITVGTRGSTLARIQTETIVQAIRSHFPDIEIATRVISTEGDRVQDVSVSQLGDKGVFVRNIETALLSGEIDLAVHSLKDVPTDEDVTGLKIAAYSPREDARDVLVSRDKRNFGDQAPGAIVGTSSLRRRSQLRACRPDLHVTDIRGNVDTRLRKLQAGQYDALILAAAGLLRLGLSDHIAEYFHIGIFTPDAGQGILAVQTRCDDRLDEITEQLDDQCSRLAAGAERACVRALGADCRSPVGAYASLEDNEMVIVGMAAREDGSQVYRATLRGTASESSELGKELGTRLLRALGLPGATEAKTYTEP